jgi:ribonuclease HII
VPDLSHETRLGGIVAGIDEVGRGPLAGPVLAAAVILPAGLDPALAARIDDSKKLKAALREQVAAALAGSGAVIGIGAASVAEIAALNILQASYLAMRRAVVRLAVRPDHALVDGSGVPTLDLPCTALVRGDALSLSIAAASIIAKVTRDRAMARLGRRHPAYGWGRNAGYGTAEHRAAIGAHGATPHHRRGFGALLS